MNVRSKKHDDARYSDESSEMRPAIEFVGMSDIFDPAKTLKSTRVVDVRPMEQ